MNIQIFIEHFATAINKKENTILTCDTDFWDLEEWSSLTALAVVSMIDEEYGVVLRSTDVKGVRTIGELYNVVNTKSQL